MEAIHNRRDCRFSVLLDHVSDNYERNWDDLNQQATAPGPVFAKNQADLRRRIRRRWGTPAQSKPTGEQARSEELMEATYQCMRCTHCLVFRAESASSCMRRILILLACTAGPRLPVCAAGATILFSCVTAAYAPRRLDSTVSWRGDVICDLPVFFRAGFAANQQGTEHHGGEVAGHQIISRGG